MFTEAEKERIRYHLGYGSADPAAAISFGLPALIQPLFIVEKAMDLLPQPAEERVRKLLAVMDGIECRLVAAQDRLAAIRLGDLELRENEPDKLEREYYRWARRLAETLRVPLYPYAARFSGGMGGVGNVPVSG
jgi:hypothetical protein